MERFQLVNELLSDFFVLSVKFHNYHFNVKGREFKQTHLALEEGYNDFLEKFDELAEYLKMNEQIPYGTIKDYLAHSKVEEDPAKVFTIEETYQMMLDSYHYLLSSIAKLRDLSSHEDDFGLVNRLEDYYNQYLKAKWFVEATL